MADPKTPHQLLPKPTRLLTPSEAAGYLSISLRTLTRLTAPGTLPHVRIGGAAGLCGAPARWRLRRWDTWLQIWRGLALFRAMCLAVLGRRANLHVVIMTITSAIFALYVDFVQIWLHVPRLVLHPHSRQRLEISHDGPHTHL